MNVSVGSWLEIGAHPRRPNAPNISDNLTKVAGKHTLKAGFYWDFAQNNQTTGGYQFSSQGTADFENWGATPSGNPMADFLLGRATAFSQQDGAPVADFKYYQYSFYANDQINGSPAFTVGRRVVEFTAKYNF